MGAMALFDSHVEANPDDPAGYHGWAESALFEIQQNGNIDDKGGDRINEGQVAAYFRKASGLEPDNAEYLAAHANALLEFDRIPMAVREFQKLRDLGTSSDEVVPSVRGGPHVDRRRRPQDRLRPKPPLRPAVRPSGH